MGPINYIKDTGPTIYNRDPIRASISLDKLPGVATPPEHGGPSIVDGTTHLVLQKEFQFDFTIALIIRGKPVLQIAILP